MYTKVKIFNLALGALLLNKKIADVDSDASTENQTLKIHYDTAFRATLTDLDLDSTSTQAELELVTTDPNDLWGYAYKYPVNCAFFRRIQSAIVKDKRSTHISKKIGLHNGQKVIFTNEQGAIGEYIPHDLSLATLSAPVGLAIAYRLAILSAPLISGKGAKELRKQIEAMYNLAKSEAQEQDQLENMNYDDDDVISEFVDARTE